MTIKSNVGTLTIKLLLAAQMLFGCVSETDLEHTQKLSNVRKNEYGALQITWGVMPADLDYVVSCHVAKDNEPGIEFARITKSDVDDLSFQVSSIGEITRIQVGCRDSSRATLMNKNALRRNKLEIMVTGSP